MGRCSAGGCTPILTNVPFLVGIGLGIVAVVVLAILFWGRPVRWFFLPDQFRAEEAGRRRRRLRSRRSDAPDAEGVRRRRMMPWRTKDRRPGRDG